MLPPIIIANNEYGKISLALSFVIPKRGSAQKGWSMFVIWSPYAKAIIALFKGTPNLSADSTTIGPCITHCPPPLGTNILTNPALKKVTTGRVVTLENDTKKFDILRASRLLKAGIEVTGRSYRKRFFEEVATKINHWLSKNNL